MKVFVCIDEKNGMLFNKRRLSKDKAVVEKIASFLKLSPIFVSEYSKKILPYGIVVEDFNKGNNFAFIENPKDLPNEIEMFYVFNWNRHYPSDTKLEFDFTDYDIVSVEDFIGNSHENITLTIYKKKG